MLIDRYFFAKCKDDYMNNDIVIFKNGELELEVSVSQDRETVWLSLDQMAELFNRDKSTIS